MRYTMDAFIQAVEDARRRLIRETGQNVSMRELIRRAGYSERERAGVAYHLTPDRTGNRWAKGHSVPPELVRRLADVLPISYDELARAAQTAAGYTITVSSADVPAVVARFFDDSDVSDNHKAEVTARLLRIIAEEAGRRVGS